MFFVDVVVCAIHSAGMSSMLAEGVVAVGRTLGCLPKLTKLDLYGSSLVCLHFVHQHQKTLCSDGTSSSQGEIELRTINRLVVVDPQKSAQQEMS